MKSRVSGAGGLAVNVEGTAGTAPNAPLKMRDHRRRAAVAWQPPACRTWCRARWGTANRYCGLRHGLGAEILRPPDLRGRRVCRPRHRYRAAQPAACRDLLGRSHPGGTAASHERRGDDFCQRLCRARRGDRLPGRPCAQGGAGALCRRHARRRAFRRRSEAHRQSFGRPVAGRDRHARPHRDHRAGVASARFCRGRREARRSAAPR